MRCIFANRYAQLVLALCIPAIAMSGDLSQSDREKGSVYLKESRDCVIGATKGLSEAQWKFKPAADKWSIAELAEHLALSGEYILTLLDTELKKEPVDAAAHDAKQVDELILSKIPDRTKKFQAPPPLVPTGRWTPSEALAHFQKAHDRLSAILASPVDLRAHLLDLPPIGQKADVYEFVLTAAGHNERHVKQMLEVKANPNFPAN